MKSETESPSTVCTKCGGTVVPILYGMPAGEAWEMVDRGEIVLGGCCITPGQPSERCRDCGATPPRAARAWPFVWGDDSDYFADDTDE